MRVILDTNVLLAALISAEGAPGLIYQEWRNGRFELVTSAAQLEELRRVSRYPKLQRILPAHRIGALINNLQGAEVLATLPILPATLATDDPDDDFLLATALASQADWLITGDKRAGLLERGHLGRTRIARPSVFCAEGL